MSSCVYKYCKNTYFKAQKNGENLQFFRFPTDLTMRDKWRARCGLESDHEFKTHHRVCSKHFASADYAQRGQRLDLSVTALPLQFQYYTEKHTSTTEPIDVDKIDQSIKMNDSGCTTVIGRRSVRRKTTTTATTSTAPSQAPFTLLKPNCCGNCGLAFSKANPCARKFLLSLEDSQSTREGKQKQTVEIYLGLQTVFEWKYDFEKGVIDNVLDKAVALCSSCGIALAKLFRAVKAFEDLTASFSYVDLLSKKFLKQLKSETGISEDVKRESGRPCYRVSSGSGSDDDGGDEPMDTGDPDYNPSDSEEYKQEQPPAPPVPEVVLPITVPDEIIHTGDTDDEVDVERLTKENICYKCAAGFDKPSNLRRHLLLTHGIGDREKEFVCNICGKAYYFAHLLKNHMVHHSDARPYICPFEGCGKAFKCSPSLRQHKIHAHMPDHFPYPCKFCPRKFKVRRDKDVHETYMHKTPKGVRRFSCINGCGSSYKRKFSMLEHSRKFCAKRPYHSGSEGELDEAVQSIAGDENGAQRIRKAKPRRKYPPKTYICKRGCGAQYKCYKAIKRHDSLCQFSEGDKVNENPEETSVKDDDDDDVQEISASSTVSRDKPQPPAETHSQQRSEEFIEEPSEIDFMGIINSIGI